jgi:hypothetical protein
MGLDLNSQVGVRPPVKAASGGMGMLDRYMGRWGVDCRVLSVD